MDARVLVRREASFSMSTVGTLVTSTLARGGASMSTAGTKPGTLARPSGSRKLFRETATLGCELRDTEATLGA
jgi:hypothetical protein